MDQLINQVKYAINALSVPNETRNANDWLISFEKSSEAWSASEQLLNEPPGMYRFFGAKFLYSKIQKQSILLSEDSSNALLQVLVQYIIRMSQESPVEFNVVRYLALGLSALLLQKNKEGTVHQILQWLNPIIASSPITLLTLLTVLPEEVFNGQIDVAAEVRDSFVIQLTTSAQEVFKFLNYMWDSSSNDGTKIKVIQCLTNWIDITEIPIAILLADPLTSKCVDQLQSSDVELFETSVDLAIAIIRRYRTGDMETMVNFIFPRMISLLPRWDRLVNGCKNVENGDDLDEDLRNEGFAISKLFSEAAEHCIDVFCHLELKLGQQDILVQLLKCANFHLDHNVSRMPLKFFYDLSIHLKNDQDPSFVQHFFSLYGQLLEISVQRIALPTSIVSLTKIPDNYMDIRMDWKEVVLDCCDMLGSVKCMEVLCMIMENEIRQNNSLHSLNWSKIEAVLFCIRAIANLVSNEGSPNIPQLITFMHTIPKNLQVLQQTSVELFGGLAPWLNKNPSYIPMILGKLIADLDSKHLSKPASRSILDVFKSCSTHNNLPVIDIHNRLVYLREQKLISLEPELQLLEALVTAAAKLGPESGNVIKELARPIAMTLERSVKLLDVDSKMIIEDIDRFATIFRSYTIDDANLLEIFLSIQPLLEMTLDKIRGDTIGEKVCRCYKYAVRACKSQFSPYLGQFCEHLARRFEIHKTASFLYCASVCVSTFALVDRGKFVPFLYNMISMMSNVFFSNFASLEHFELKPDVAEEYFFLMAKLLQYCPSPLIENNSSNVMGLINAGLTGVCINHRETQKGVLMFFERLIQLISFWEKGTSNYSRALDLIENVALSLCIALFQLLSAAKQAHAIDESNGSISDVMWLLRKNFPTKFTVSIYFSNFIFNSVTILFIIILSTGFKRRWLLLVKLHRL